MGNETPVDFHCCVALVNADFIRSHFPQICDADMRILTMYSMRPGSDHDSFIWRTRWLRRRFQAGRIANPGVYLIAEEKYNTAHATLRSVVERCIGLLKSRFRCMQRYRTLLYEPQRAANIGDKDDDDESDDDSSTSSSSELDNNGDPIPHGVPRNSGKCSQQQLQEVLIRPLRPLLLLEALLL
ncbi:hypothetical protein HPB49_008309 [Dermacentor silvarum]|uniref:Uncharacterized protein n=1 Tax=Dermacentor silvarum TaxID=543639 RepID=A0ACB8D3W9_DERSI|nr:hypothetical protein HPB49_008309 [Dermacentor silvarum]